MNTTTATIGIPYAFNCEECYRAVICPDCGAHIEQGVKGKKYAQHYAAQHADDPSDGDFTVAPDGCPLS